jgi:hypothetical protein
VLVCDGRGGMAQRVKVLHVTEAFAAGVLTLIDSLSRRQGEVGARSGFFLALKRPMMRLSGPVSKATSTW